MKWRSSERAGDWIPGAVIGDPDQPASLKRGRPGIAELYRLPSRTAGSARLSVFPLHSLRALAKNPLAHIGRALNQFNALIFAANQETNRIQVHQCDFAHVQNLALAAIIDCRTDAAEKVRLNPSA